MDTINDRTFGTTSYVTLAVFTACVHLCTYWYTYRNELYKRIQVAGPTKDGHSSSEAKRKYRQSALSILTEGKRTASACIENHNLLAQSKLQWKLKREKAKGAFQVYTEAGVMIILPSKCLAEIKSDARFGTDDASRKVSITAQFTSLASVPESLADSAAPAQTFMAEIPGFDGFHALLNHNMLQDMIRTKLTQSLGTMTSEIVEETTLAAE